MNTTQLVVPKDHREEVMRVGHEILFGGPYEVIEKVGLNDYRIKFPKGPKLLHGNLLKFYTDREKVGESQGDSSPGPQHSGEHNVSVRAVIDMEEEGPDTGSPLFPTDGGKEIYKDVLLSPELDRTHQKELDLLLQRFDKVLTKRPGRTDLIEHEIRLIDDNPVCQSMYPTPFAMRETIEKEVNELLEMGLIEPSQSRYSSPVVMVRKSAFVCTFAS
ncbi:hypothetical protein Bpfe_020455 [Biomphalaria pfeifferi]|uniref:Reverse transcriptase domain-containing protein n=1 Tax=Biomphalaria pfeifferi TaxID=112525 RepID=A0AAD8F4U7_BIOPF|nr:hypothetical protein Bpfe_020455 [Biomphalaria pfeifferi]